VCAGPGGQGFSDAFLEEPCAIEGEAVNLGGGVKGGEDKRAVVRHGSQQELPLAYYKKS